MSSPPNSSAAAIESLQAAASAAGAPNQLNSLDQSQIVALLRQLPGVFNKLAEHGSLKEAAAETLSNLSQATIQQQQAHFQSFPPGPLDPGPNSHPHGPPSLGMGLGPAPGQGPSNDTAMHPVDTSMDDGGGGDGEGGEKTSGGRRRNGPPTHNGAVMGSDQWSRQRKDNHKEVERRRRGNINEGINELARIVPNGTGEKAKGAILSRAVQYIHHLKENEARNIEKWTLEKLLMDQAMGDLQSQLEEVKRLWEEERRLRERAELQLAALGASVAENAEGAAAPKKRPGDDEGADASERDASRLGGAVDAEDERGTKRPRRD